MRLSQPLPRQCALGFYGWAFFVDSDARLCRRCPNLRLTLRRSMLVADAGGSQHHDNFSTVASCGGLFRGWSNAIGTTPPKPPTQASIAAGCPGGSTATRCTYGIRLPLASGFLCHGATCAVGDHLLESRMPRFGSWGVALS